MLVALFLLSVGSDSVSRQSCRSAGDLPALRSLLSLPFSTSGLHTHTHTEHIRHTGSLLLHLSHMHTPLLTHQRRKSWTQTRTVLLQVMKDILKASKVSHLLPSCATYASEGKQGKSAESFNPTEKQDVEAEISSVSLRTPGL